MGRATEALPARLDVRQRHDAHAIIDELRPLPDELVLNKTTGGAFNSTALHQILRNMGIQHLVITGVATNACVESTARGAADLGFWSVMVDDACATFDPAMHESTLKNFRTIFGKVKTTREVLDDLAERLGVPPPAVAAAVHDTAPLDRAIVATQADGNRSAFPKIHFEMDPDKTVLLIVDMQRFCASPDYGVGAYLGGADNPLGRYYFDRLYSAVIPNNQRLLAFARENGIKVAFLTIGPETLAGHELSPLHRAKWTRRRALSPIGETFVRGTPENGVIDELRPLPDEPVINKITAGGFVSTPLDVYLRGMGAEYLLVTGVATNACVESTARDASDRGYWTYLVDDACGAFDPESHAATLRNFAADVRPRRDNRDGHRGVEREHRGGQAGGADPRSGGRRPGRPDDAPACAFGYRATQTIVPCGVMKGSMRTRRTTRPPARG